MQAVALFAIVVGGFVVTFFWAVGRLLIGQDLPRAFEYAGTETARRLGGVFVPGSLRNRRIRFAHQTRPAEIVFHPEENGRPARTGVVFRLDGPLPGTLHLCHARMADVLGTMYGKRDISIGDPAFDERFVLRATPVAFAHRLFAAERRPRLTGTLLELVRLGTPEIEVTRDHLAVRVPVLLDDPPRLVELARLAAEVLEIARETAPGVESAWASLKKGEGQCQVCGSALAEDVVICRACRTPHHADCWRWTGECSTFACRETRYLRN